MKLSDTSVKIYVAKKTSATQVELVEIEDHIIPAATAVILKADGAKELTLEATDEAGDKAKAADNLLKGNGYSTKAAAGKSTYALAFNPAENKVQFGLVKTEWPSPPSRPTSSWTTLQVPPLLSSLPFPPL